MQNVLKRKINEKYVLLKILYQKHIFFDILDLSISITVKKLFFGGRPQKPDFDLRGGGVKKLRTCPQLVLTPTLIGLKIMFYAI